MSLLIMPPARERLSHHPHPSDQRIGKPEAASIYYLAATCFIPPQFASLNMSFVHLTIVRLDHLKQVAIDSA